MSCLSTQFVSQQSCAIAARRMSSLTGSSIVSYPTTVSIVYDISEFLIKGTFPCCDPDLGITRRKISNPIRELYSLSFDHRSIDWTSARVIDLLSCFSVIVQK